MSEYKVNKKHWVMWFFSFLVPVRKIWKMAVAVDHPVSPLWASFVRTRANYWTVWGGRTWRNGERGGVYSCVVSMEIRNSIRRWEGWEGVLKKGQLTVIHRHLHLHLHHLNLHLHLHLHLHQCHHFHHLPQAPNTCADGWLIIASEVRLPVRREQAGGDNPLRGEERLKSISPISSSSNIVLLLLLFYIIKYVPSLKRNVWFKINFLVFWVHMVDWYLVHWYPLVHTGTWWYLIVPGCNW